MTLGQVGQFARAKTNGACGDLDLCGVVLSWHAAKWPLANYRCWPILLKDSKTQSLRIRAKKQCS